MSRYEEDQHYHAGYRARGSDARKDSDDMQGSRTWPERGDRMRDEARFRGAESARRGRRAPFGPQPGREPDMQAHDGYAETYSPSGSGRRYASAQYEDEGGLSADSQNAGRAGLPGQGSDAQGYRTGYSQGRHGYSRSPDADVGVGGYGQPERGQGGYGRFADSGDDRYRDEGQRAHGRFRGHGPKGYRRSDERITEDLNERLTEDPLLDASGITVEVREGVATLKGSVESRWMKHRAEDIVDACSGVHDVRNEIRVAGKPSRTPSEGSNAADASGEESQNSG